MSINVYNAPDVERIQTANVFRTSESNRERNFHPGNSYVRQSYLGTDALQLSEDYSYPVQQYRRQTASYNYSNLTRLILIFMAIISLIICSLIVLVVLGGLISLIVVALVIFFSVFLYSINLNPFDKTSYKKVLAYLV